MNLFFLAGEKSGDLLGSKLLRELKGQGEFWGVGGEKMRSQGLTPILYTESFEVMGIADTLLSLPRQIKQFFQIRDAILQRNPDGCILIDYPGFNLKLAKSLRKKGYRGKIIQYVCPTVWAWGKDRIQKMVNTLDLLLTIYPFETSYFKETPLSVKYVGSPILESVGAHLYNQKWQQSIGIKPSGPIIALFPGSRKGEISLNLPLQIEAAEILHQKFQDVQFAISMAHDEMLPFVQQLIQQSSLKLNTHIFLIPKSFSYELMRDCQSAIVKSGSVTLEMALHQKPSVIIYELSLINQFFAKYVLKLDLKHYCIVNILADKTVFPEFIGKDVTAEKIAEALERLHIDGQERWSCQKGCQSILKILNQGEASKQAANEILKVLK
jgi:lipid-A-disaccharide synthase